MDQTSEVTKIKTEPTGLTSSNREDIPTVVQMNIIKKETDYVTRSEFDIKSESQENESEFPVIANISYEICQNYEMEIETEEPMIKIEYVDVVDEIIKDPLDVSNEIKDVEHTPIDLDQGESRIKIELLDRENEENLLESDEDDLHGSGSNHELLIRNDSNHKDIKHICYVCNKTFAQKRLLHKHLRIHTGMKPYTCDVCEKSFNQKCNLDSHMLIHSGEKPHSCDECKEVFRARSTLNKHKLIHSSVKAFSCHMCNKSFTLKHHLVVHKRMHTGEKPYTCDLCKKAFAQKSALNTHKHTHTGEKSYSCNLCTKSFADKSRLNRHKKIHKN